MLTVSQEDGNVATTSFEVGLKVEISNGTTQKVGLDDDDDLDDPIDVTDTDGDGEIPPEEAAIQIASRVDGHDNLSTDKRDQNGDGAFVNIEEEDKDVDGQSADVVIQDTDENHVDITLIKLKFTDSVGNQFEQRTQIDRPK